MRSSQKVLLLAPMLLVFVGVGAAAYWASFLRYDEKLGADLDRYSRALEGYRDALDESSTTKERLAATAQTTLGFSAEQVDSAFRDGLRQLALDAGLVVDEIVVTTQPARPVKNPAVEARVEEFRRVKSEVVAISDCYMMDAELRGGGTFPAVARLLALAQSQPWIWSVRGFSLKPRDKQATAFDIRIDVTTAFMPDLAAVKPAGETGDGAGGDGESGPSLPIVDPTAEQVLATGTIVSRNVFAPPPPLPSEPVSVAEAAAPPGTAAASDPPAPNPPPPPPPYHEWRYSGFTNSPVQGLLVFMVNVRTGAGLMVGPGERVLDATLVDAGEQRAVFAIGEQRYEIALDKTLAERHAIE